MILNSIDQLGNAYCQQLAASGFNIILCGPPIDQKRMEHQATVLKQKYEVRTFVLVVDYMQLGGGARNSNVNQTYQEISNILSEYEICILVNNQTYSVPFDYARADLMNQSLEACVAQINKHINCSMIIQ